MSLCGECDENVMKLPCILLRESQPQLLGPPLQDIPETASMEDA